ncbi:hypothetical protein B0H65DRAFT_417475 [Neurospora tetraspora]|uniref:Uncharacterized protein n=1 Tax=Neurospora tetraspora TaxID=94610 RepID=A0AAE0JPZ0_9PEZI|nr:hypothetical protein B0H65DRAFT_417475 [Neurospora tetraspora]
MSGPSTEGGRPKLRGAGEMKKNMDEKFLSFLREYATYYAECPPSFKKYLERHVFPACKEADKIDQLQLFLCNPEILDYGLGVEFMEEASHYTIWDYWFQGAEGSVVLPFHPIPDNYKPWPKEAEKTMKAAYIIDDPGRALSAGVHEIRLDDQKNGATMSIVPPGPFRSLPSVLGPDGEQGDMFGDILGQMKELEKLQFPATYGPTTAAVEGGQLVDPVVDRTGPDWTVDSEYEGFRQPPLAVRLEHINNLLCEEDMYRDLNWAQKFAETVRYLQWLSDEDPKGQLANASQQTQKMHANALQKVRVHELFDYYNAQPTPLIINPLPKGSLKSTRLNWLGDVHNWPIPTTNPVPDKRDLMPRPTYPRPVEPVNTMLIDEPDNYELFEEFKHDQREVWQDDEGDDNLALVESEAFVKFSGSKYAGWVRHDPTTNTKVLADDTIIIPNDPRSFARERGARRAGLQQMLRAYQTSVKEHMASPLRTLQLPIDAAVLHKITRDTDGVQFVPARIPDEKIQAQADTMPFTVQFPKYLESLKHIRERALKRVEALRRQDRRWVTLPQNVVTGGPFVWRMVDPDVQLKQDILDQCNITYQLLSAAQRRAPRLLLDEVRAMIDRGVSGEFHNHDVPAEVRLHGDELEIVGTTHPRKAPCYVDLEEDIPWLKFLASEAVNDGNWEPNNFYPNEPKEKYKLFHIFARRVQKILDDRDPDSLFADADAQVTVEQLLSKINAGREGCPVDKVVFHPYDAMAWLDRLADTGHVRFQLDPSCYGVVMRPLNKYFPENRVIWPGPTAHREKPGFKLGYISTWQQILCPGIDRSQEILPDTQGSSPVWNFFMALGFRLGYTIYMLNQERAEQGRFKPQPVPAEYLTESLTTFEAECKTEIQHAFGKDDGGLVSLQQLIQRLSPRDYTGAEMTEAEAFAVVKRKLLEESICNLTMLVPGRRVVYYGRDPATGEVKHMTVRKRDVSWEFASARSSSTTSGQGTKKRAFQYWRLDRWPLGVGYTSEETERKIRDKKDVDPKMVYDPVAEDPISEKYRRPKLRRFGEDEKVKMKRGPAVYPVGDTVRQAWRVEESMTESAYRALGLSPPSAAENRRKRTWSQAIGTLLNPFSNDKDGNVPAADVPEDERRVRPKLDDLAKGVVVSSWNPDRIRQVAQEEGYALESVDVKEILKEMEKMRREEVEQGA